jgi:hypothetical protein
MSTIYQLQLFNGKAYETVRTLEADRPDALRPEVYPGRAWRIVNAAKDRPARPRYTVPRGGTAGSMSKDETVRAYLDWCMARDVAPTFYYERSYSFWWPKGKPYRLVPRADFLGDAPANEWAEGDAE